MNYQRIPLTDLDKIEIGSSLGVVSVVMVAYYGSNIARCAYDDYLSLYFHCFSVELSAVKTLRI